MQIVIRWLKQNKHGTAIIEYVILLAFVAAVGVSFISDGLHGAMSSTIKNVASIIGGANAGDNIIASSGELHEKFLMGNSKFEGMKDSGYPFDPHYRYAIFGSDGNLIQLDPNSNYQLVVDLSKLPNDLQPSDMKACLFLWGSPDEKAKLDTADMQFDGSKNKEKGTQFVVNEEAKTATYEFSTNDSNTNFGMNIVLNQSAINDANKEAIKNHYKDFLRLEKVN